jgi:hypothetical protein
VLPGELGRWLLGDVGAPLAAAVVVVAVARLAFELPAPYAGMLAALAAVSCAALIAAIAATPEARAALAARLHGKAPARPA